MKSFRIFSTIILCLTLQSAFAREPEQVKNVIMMIPDGTSLSVLSLSRWYKSAVDTAQNKYQYIDRVHLNIDPFICGLVITHSSDAPIGDSAPTGSAYATGVVSQSGYVAAYPEKTNQDVVFVDSTLANTPAMTILEAAKLKGKATGLVVTCEFPHATPADFSSHHYNRGKTDILASQMIHNNIDVVFGGGTNYLKEGERYLKDNGWDVITKYNYDQFKSYSRKKVWGLFAPEFLPYESERDSLTCPSLEEMTDKALKILSENKNGFFLMIEGSKVDWAAHANDPAGIVSEFLAFDKAVGRVMQFAKENGETAVVICPDHGNSGLSIGNKNTTGENRYDKLSKKKIIRPLMDKSTPDSLSFIGFTTKGHTGEDVFLAMYHPKGDIMTGVVHNTQINRYLQQVTGIENLADSTLNYFCGHKTLFPKNEYKCVFDSTLSKSAPTLIVTSLKTKKTISLKAFENTAVLNGKTKIPCNTVFVYIDKNKEFYIPKRLKELVD